MEILTSGQLRLLQAFGARDFFRCNFVAAGKKRPGIEPYWLARAFLQVRLIEKLPVMLKPVTLDELKAFFVNMAERLMTSHA